MTPSISARISLRRCSHVYKNASWIMDYTRVSPRRSENVRRLNGQQGLDAF